MTDDSGASYVCHKLLCIVQDTRLTRDVVVTQLRNMIEYFSNEGLWDEIVKVLNHGAKKYGPVNWRKGTRWSRYVDAALRHGVAVCRGEEFDPESGYLHRAHMAVNIMFLYDYVIYDILDNDVWDFGNVKKD